MRYLGAATMSAGAHTGLGSFAPAYASAFRAYLLDPGEATLHVAYELGREAVTRHLSVLDLAVAHHEALLSALAGVSDSAETQGMTRAAGLLPREPLCA